MINGVENHKPGLFRWIVLGLPLVVLLGVSGCAKISHQMRYHMHFGHNRPLPGLPYYHCKHCGQIVPKAGHECGIALSHGPFFGYNATCWRDWPEGWVGCPIQEIQPGEVIETPGEQSGGPPPPQAPSAYPAGSPIFSVRPGAPDKTQAGRELTAMPWSVSDADDPAPTAPAATPPSEPHARTRTDNQPEAPSHQWAPRQSRAAAPALIPEHVTRLETDDDTHDDIHSVLSEPAAAGDPSDETPQEMVDNAPSWDDVTVPDDVSGGDDRDLLDHGPPQHGAASPPQVTTAPDVRPPSQQPAPTLAPQPVDTPVIEDPPTPQASSVDRQPAQQEQQPEETAASAPRPAHSQATDSRRPTPQYSAVPPAPLPGRSLQTVAPSSSDANASGPDAQQGRGLMDWRTSSTRRLDSVARRLESVRKSSRTQLYMVGVAPREPVAARSVANDDLRDSRKRAAPAAAPVEQPTEQPKAYRPTARVTDQQRRTRSTGSRTVRYRSQLRSKHAQDAPNGSAEPSTQPVAPPDERPEPVRVRLIGYGDQAAL